MKKLIFIIFIFLSYISFAQIEIGEGNISINRTTHDITIHSLSADTSTLLIDEDTIIINGFLIQDDILHAFYHFEDSSVVVAIDYRDTLYQVTNTTNNLFINEESKGFILSGDTITYNYNRHAHIKFEVDFVASDGNGEDWQMKIYNITDDRLIPGKGEMTTSGANNVNTVSFFAYDKQADYGDQYIVLIRNITNANDITFKDASLFITVTHN